MYALAASICWGLGYVALERLLSGVSVPFAMLLHTLFRGALYAGVFFAVAKDKIASDGRTLAADPALWPWVALYLCALTAGDWCATQAVSKSNSTVTALVEISYPIWTAVFAWVLLGRAGYDWRTVAGGGLVLAGVALVASSPASR